MSWFIASIAITLCYILLSLSFFFPGKFIQFKNMDRIDPQLKWMILAMSICSAMVCIWMGFDLFVITSYLETL